jgi:hypothetical protein
MEGICHSSIARCLSCRDLYAGVFASLLIGGGGVVRLGRVAAYLVLDEQLNTLDRGGSGLGDGGGNTTHCGLLVHRFLSRPLGLSSCPAGNRSIEWKTRPNLLKKSTTKPYHEMPVSDRKRSGTNKQSQHGRPSPVASTTIARLHRCRRATLSRALG